MTSKAERNADLAAAYQRGDDDALLELLRLNGGIVGRAINRYRVPMRALGMDLEDVRQEAAVALVEATRSWDASRGAPWSLWAYHAICGRYLRFVRAALKSRGGRWDPVTHAVTMPVTMSLQDTTTGHDDAPVLADVVPGGTRPDEAAVDLVELSDAIAAEIKAKYLLAGNRRKAARDIWGPLEENQ